MTIYAHIICPKCDFLYCYHVDNDWGRLHCSRCDYTWHAPERTTWRHITLLHGEAVANPNMPQN